MNILQWWKLKKLLKTADKEYIEILERHNKFWKEQTYKHRDLYWRTKEELDGLLMLNGDESRKIAYALECTFGFGDKLAEKIYDHLKEKTGEDYRL